MERKSSDATSLSSVAMTPARIALPPCSRDCGTDPADRDFWIEDCERQRRDYAPMGCLDAFDAWLACTTTNDYDCNTDSGCERTQQGYFACQSQFVSRTGCTRLGSRDDELCGGQTPHAFRVSQRRARQLRTRERWRDDVLLSSVGVTGASQVVAQVRSLIESRAGGPIEGPASALSRGGGPPARGSVVGRPYRPVDGPSMVISSTSCRCQGSRGSSMRQVVSSDGRQND